MPNERKSYALKVVRASTGQDPEQLLRRLYVDERRSQREIAQALGVSRSAVGAWLQSFGITREPLEPIEPMIAAS